MPMCNILKPLWRQEILMINSIVICSDSTCSNEDIFLQDFRVILKRSLSQIITQYYMYNGICRKWVNVLHHSTNSLFIE